MKPREARPLPSKRPSVPEPLERPVSFQGVTYQRERLAGIARELLPLFKRHYAELAVDPDRAPLDVDWPRYLDLDLIGALQVITVRVGPALVGYIFNIVGPHLHKRSTRWCHVDIYWLDPAYRVGLRGYRLFVENERFLKAAGVKKIVVSEKAHFKNDFGRQVGILFKRLGYAPEDISYGKWIGD